MGEFYIGSIILFAGNFAPLGWQACDGTLLPIAQNEALYALLGTTYGGDGVSTFAVPDLRGNVPVSAGQPRGGGSYVLGQIGGTESVTITSQQMPQHTHPQETFSFAFNVSDGTADAVTPRGGTFANSGSTPIYAAAENGAVMNPAFVTTNVTLGVAGGNQPIPTMGPFLAIGYCICTQGIFPSQN